ncbi:MAG: HEAT repeat domain-containing protein [Candidatus Thermoplasmatota archaeon]
MIYNLLGEWVFGLVYYFMIFLGIVLLIISIAYVWLVYRNVKRRKWLENRKPYWEEVLKEYEDGNIEKRQLIKKLDYKNEYFRDYLIELARKDKFSKDLLNDIYIECGFVVEDVDRSKSKRWYKKAQTFAVWKHLRILPTDHYVVYQMLSQNNEVRLAALDLLSINRHPILTKKLEDIFAFYSTHVDYYLNVKLMAAEIPVEGLEQLVQSDNRRLKKTGVILLGREGEKDSIDLLKKFKDEPEDIRCEVVKSIGRIKSIDGLDILEEMKKDESTRVRKEIARALGKISYQDPLASSDQPPKVPLEERIKKIISLLDELADDENPIVRWNAFFALSNLGEKGREKIEEYRDEYPGIAKEALLKSFSGGVNFDAL